MNAAGPLPWALTFSYGRALQAAAIKAWRQGRASLPASAPSATAPAERLAARQIGKGAGSCLRRACLFWPRKSPALAAGFFVYGHPRYDRRPCRLSRVARLARPFRSMSGSGHCRVRRRNPATWLTRPRGPGGHLARKAIRCRSGELPSEAAASEWKILVRWCRSQARYAVHGSRRAGFEQDMVTRSGPMSPYRSLRRAGAPRVWFPRRSTSASWCASRVFRAGSTPTEARAEWPSTSSATCRSSPSSRCGTRASRHAPACAPVQRRTSGSASRDAAQASQASEACEGAT